MVTAFRQKQSYLGFVGTGIGKIKCDKSRLQISIGFGLQIPTKWVTKSGRNHKVRQGLQSATILQSVVVHKATDYIYFIMHHVQ